MVIAKQFQTKNYHEKCCDKRDATPDLFDEILTVSKAAHLKLKQKYLQIKICLKKRLFEQNGPYLFIKFIEFVNNISNAMLIPNVMNNGKNRDRRNNNKRYRRDFVMNNIFDADGALWLSFFLRENEYFVQN